MTKTTNLPGAPVIAEIIGNTAGGSTVRQSVADLATQLAGSGSLAAAIDAAAAGLVRTDSWPALMAIVGTRSGQPADCVTTLTTTHTDPVSGAVVADAGQYAWSTSPAGWNRIGDLAESVSAGLTRAEAANAPARRLLRSTTSPSPYVRGDVSRRTFAGGKFARTDAATTEAFLFVGQSLAEGAQTSADAPIATAPIYPSRAVMPETGPRYYCAGTYFAGNLSRHFGRLVPAREDIDPWGFKESPVTSFTSHYLALRDAALGRLPGRVAAMVAALGGQPIVNLGPGTAPWEQGLIGMAKMIEAEARIGKRLVIPAFIYNQGESDIYGTGWAYLRRLMAYRRALATAIKDLTGQSNEPIMFLVQTSTVGSNLPAPQMSVQLSQLEAARLDPYIRVAGPQYAFGREASSNAASSAVHLSSAGVSQLGQMLARAVFGELHDAGGSWIPLQIRDAVMISPVVIRLYLDVPRPPVVIDTSGAITAVVANAGFRVLPPDPASHTAGGAALSIASVSVPSGATDVIDVTLSLPPPYPYVYLTCADRRDVAGEPAANYATIRDGPIVGARTNVRDSAAHPSLFGQPDQYNWLVMDCRRVATY